jgi:hypothetical protein|nr:MAG TPA: hypothetical protein [Caudoviricetes sp.]
MYIELKRIDIDEEQLLKNLKRDIDFLMKFDLTNRICIGPDGGVFTQYTADEITCAYSISNEPISFLTISCYSSNNEISYRLRYQKRYEIYQITMSKEEVYTHLSEDFLTYLQHHIKPKR